MAFFLLNILLGVLWMLMWGSFDSYTFLLGFVLGYLLIALISRAVGGTSYVGKVRQLVSFGLYFVRILFVSNVQVAKAVLKPGEFVEASRIIRYDIAGLSDLQITVVANAITLTPGTLSMDVSDDRRWLYIHCMFGRDRAAILRDLDELKNRILAEVFS